MNEKEHVIKILQEVLQALKKEDVIKLKDLSNQTIHTASSEQTSESISLAVMVYSLGKMIERKTYKCADGLCGMVETSLKKAINELKNNDEISYKNTLKQIQKSIKNLSKEYKKYIQDVFIKAKINKASKIYEHGISMEKTAKLLGITMFDLANYIGQKEYAEPPENKTLDTKSRIKLAEEMFL